MDKGALEAMRAAIKRYNAIDDKDKIYKLAYLQNLQVAVCMSLTPEERERLLYEALKKKYGET